MLKEKLKGYKVILASSSPRRQQFFRELGIDFEVRLKPVEEVYPSELQGSEISDFLARLKAKPFEGSLADQTILITSDTVVWYKRKSLAKAKNAKEAFNMLRTLSDDWHEVITSVCFTTKNGQRSLYHSTKVKFKELTDNEIQFYIDTYRPYDKAGAYGIQEWIGLIGIVEIQGSYSNVVGLPTHMVYETLMDMVD